MRSTNSVSLVVHKPDSSIRFFSLSRKMIGAFLIVSLLMAVTNGFSYLYLQRTERSYTSLLNESEAALNRLAFIQSRTQQQNGLLFSYLTDPSKEKEAQLAEVNDRLTAAINEMVANAGSEEEIDVRSMGDANATFKRLMEKVTDYMNKNEAGLAKAEALLWSVPLTEALTKSVAKIEAYQKAQIARQAADNERMMQQTSQTLLGLSIAAVLLSILIGLGLSRMIVRPMKAMVEGASRISACDMTAPDIVVKNRDEIRDLAFAFNQMKSNLHHIISQVGTSAAQVAASAEELSTNSSQFSQASELIATIAQRISTGSQTQVRSVRQGVSAIQETSSAVDQIAEVAQSADRQSASALQAAAEGNTAIASTKAQMNSIQMKMEALTKSVQQLGGRSVEIVKVIDVIADIAQQTNLLALNASIEAARAGEAGRGFAVVADEIRKLSGQTTVAAEEVARLIGSIRKETTEVVQSTEAGAAEVRTGIMVVQQAGESFHRIQSTVEEVTRQIREMSERSREIAHKSRMALEAISSVDEVAGDTASGARDVAVSVEGQHASMEEIVASAALLSSMAEELQSLIGKFQV